MLSVPVASYAVEGTASYERCVRGLVIGGLVIVQYFYYHYFVNSKIKDKNTVLQTSSYVLVWGPGIL